MSDATLVILGAGGHGKVCAEAAAALGALAAIAFSDDAFERGTRVLGWRVDYHDADLPALDRARHEFLIGLGQVATGAMRERLFGRLRAEDLTLATIISPAALVSPSATLAEGTFVGALALVQACARIGRNVIVNSRALVEHDAVVGDHVHLSTGSIVNGGCRIGDRCLIGSGAVVNHGVSVCADAVVGSGAVVIDDIKEPGVYVGVPARRIADAR